MTTYKKAGVDIDTGNIFINNIKGLVAKTRRPEMLEGLGGFAGLFALKKYNNPVLVSSTDGVGTKILLANQLKSWREVGIDCVAMCVNDVACFGAEPLFFLDYLASARLELNVLQEIIQGMVEGCQQTGMALLGGETAEMPGVYPPGEFDCAGFVVGVSEKEELIDGSKITPGDVVIGVASSGFHSNGFSLVRKIVADAKLDLNKPWNGEKTLGKLLLTPTKLYPKLVLHLKAKGFLKGIAHITGGGLLENPPRILPKGTQMELQKGSWEISELMLHFKKLGKLEDEEFYRVFNAGIGLVLVVPQSQSDATLQEIQNFGEKAWVIGKITQGNTEETLFL